MTDDPQKEPRPTGRASGHAKRPASSLAGLKPFLLIGLLVVIGLLVGLNFLLGGAGDSSSTNREPKPGAITIGPPPGGKPSPGGPAGKTAPAASSVSGPSLPPRAGSKPTARTPAAPSEYTFYETLKKPPHDPAATVGLTPHAAASRPASKPDPTKTAAVDSAPSKPAAAPKPAASKSGVIDTTTAGISTLHYTVQVASFRQQAMAEQMIKALNKKGHNAYLATASSSDGVTYRVRVGRFATRGEADRVAKRLATKEKLHPFVATVAPVPEKKS
ncbi:MAG TPA: SPOR domain-containing protein [Nitrospiria bacterium]|nr:SPOR domain-containing protein [Nitrospiria bacterium]